MVCVEEKTTATDGAGNSTAVVSDHFNQSVAHQTLDPSDWELFRTQAHRMLDDILDYTKNIRQRPVWQPMPEEVRQRFRGALPVQPSSVSHVHNEFMSYILPFAAGNVHPGFMGWVHGGGTAVGMLAEMLAAGLDANTGGRDHSPIEVERQVTQWMREIFQFPESATGLFVTGTSMANFVALVIARDAALGFDVRSGGVASTSKKLTAYGSTAVHACIGKAMDLCGLGSDALRLIPTDPRGRIDLCVLENEIRKDTDAGFHPFLIVGTAGTVDTGAIDDLDALANLARRRELWLHVDGAFGALAMLAPDLASKLRGIERADSLGFDLHKWGQVPYDAGFILVRDGSLQRKSFATVSGSLRREKRGLAAGSSWPCDYGPDLSRGFRALKTWFTLKAYGVTALGRVISQTCELARYLENRISNIPELELLAPVELNIVCFRYRAKESDQVNAEIVIQMQESGVVAPSATVVSGRLGVRVAIVNHRTSRVEIDALIDKAIELGREISRHVADENPPSHINEVASSPRMVWESQLREIESQILSKPGSMDLRFRKAFLLAELGRLTEARDEYIQLLERDPSHVAALNNLASVLIALGNGQAAKIAYQEAVARHPEHAASRVNLGNFLLEESERLAVRQLHTEALQNKREARHHFEQALRARANCEKAHEGLSYVLADLGEPQRAIWHRREAFRDRYVIPLPYRGAFNPVTLLLLTSPTGGNLRLQTFLDDRIFQTFVVIPEFYDRNTPLPVHQVAINGIGDTEVSRGALVQAQSVLSLSNAPVINPPVAVLETSRSNNAKRFSGIPGIVTPITTMLPRERLSDTNVASTLAERGFAFPILLRTPGFHTGQHFVLVETLRAISPALEELPGKELIVMQYLDARRADGKARKYRVMTIGGQLYPAHVAISNHWKIHYFTAEMADSSEHRSEDAAFLDDMCGVLGPAAMSALVRIQSVLGLDYGGIDFGLNERGEVLLFEANATMTVHPPESDERWNYRRPAYLNIRTAVQKMLIDRACGALKEMLPQQK